MDHVRDNESLGPKIDSAIRTDATLKPIFLDQQWLPRDAFDLIQEAIQTSVGAIFTKLTAQAVERRDTPAEYGRVLREIQRQCSGTTGPPRQGGQAAGRPSTNRQQPVHP